MKKEMTMWNNLTGKTLTLPCADGTSLAVAPTATPPKVRWSGGDAAEPDGVVVQREMRPAKFRGFPTAPGRHILPVEVVQAAREMGCHSDGHIYAWDAETRTLTRAFGWPGFGALDEEDDLGAAA